MSAFILHIRNELKDQLNYFNRSMSIRISGVSLFLRVLMSRGLVARRVSKERGLKQGLLVHSEQIVEGGGRQ